MALSESLAGDLNYVITGGSLRTNPNSGIGANACAVGISSSNPIAGIPAGSTVEAAYLYWAGSGSTVDSVVTLNGSTVTANRVFTAPFVFGATTYDFFGGFADVTSLVSGNGTYTVAGLTVNTGAPHCAVQAVLAGWSLVVVYENSVTERLRVINLFDGFQIFRGGSITLTPDNFVIPASPDGSHAIVTWEGDVENSAPNSGFAEQLTFNGTALVDALNPTNNQFNSTINTIPSSTDYGVDVDRYDISSLLSPGDTSASTTYSSGGDLVILQLEVIAVANRETADLAIDKSHSADFIARQDESFTLSVQNNGPNDIPGTITVTDTLPPELDFVSATGTDWSCAAVSQIVTCTHPGPLAINASLPDITLTTFVNESAAPGVTNTAQVSSAVFDNLSGNNADDDFVVVTLENPSLVLTKSMLTRSDPFSGAINPKSIPGAQIDYTFSVINDGPGPVDNATLVITDTVPDDMRLFVDTSAGDPITFVDGSPTSGLLFNYATDVTFSSQPGGVAPYDYVPVPDAEGYDSLVTGIRVSPSGQMDGNSVGGNPQFSVTIRMQVR
ncbi:MAG: hypothetical protein AAF465_14865 [Pseudomonadota bacterium]